MSTRRELSGDEHVLLVGTFGGGGIHQYVESQAAQLEGHVRVSTYDMRTPAKGDGVRWFLGGVLAALLAACRFPFRARPDLVHVHTSHAYSFYRASFYVLFAAAVWRRPVVVHVHGSGFDEFAATDSWLVSAVQSAVFGAADRVIVLSPYWKRVVRRECGVPAWKLRVVPNAVVPGRFEPTYDADPPRVVFVSNLVPRKGVEELVEALEALADREQSSFDAVIAGDGPLAPTVEELAAGRECVDDPGYVDESTKRQLLSSGSLFVLPTYAEGLPIAMLEGMAGGNAVVSTHVGSIPEVIDSSRGALVEPGDAVALIDALASLLDAPDRLEEMGRRNRELVEERYSWAVATDRLLDTYARVLASSAHG